jgi:hypothetical protein
MPSPLSATSMVTMPSAREPTTRTQPPERLYFTALSTKLLSTRYRPRRSHRQQRLGSTSRRSVTWARSASGAKSPATSSTTSEITTGASSSSTWPASIEASSYSSAVSRSRRSTWRTSIIASRGSSSSSSASTVVRRTVSGERSSWERSCTKRRLNSAARRTRPTSARSPTAPPPRTGKARTSHRPRRFSITRGEGRPPPAAS